MIGKLELVNLVPFIKVIQFHSNFRFTSSGELLGKEVAVKKMIIQSFEKSSIEENEFIKEVKIMRQNLIIPIP
jgi:hypothetical protein